jgi:hypothetical protein
MDEEAIISEWKDRRAENARGGSQTRSFIIAGPYMCTLGTNYRCRFLTVYPGFVRVQGPYLGFLLD